MAMKRIQFQQGMSLFEHFQGFGTDAALERTRWPDGFRWVNTVLGNLKTGFSEAYHRFDFGRYTERYLGAIAYRFNRRFDLQVLPTRLLVAALVCPPCPESWIRRVAEAPF